MLIRGTRNQIIEQFAVNRAAFATPPVPPADAPADDAKPADKPADPPEDATGPFAPKPYHADPDELVTCPTCKKGNDSDASFCDQCGFDLTSVGFVPAAYHEDADEVVTCPNCQKRDDDDASFCDQCGFKLAGATGVIVGDAPADDDADAPAGDTTGKPGAMAAATSQDNVIDADGNVDPKMVCKSEGCGHFAAAHADTEDGENTGSCAMMGCDCQAMKLDTQAAGSPSSGTDGAADGGGGPDNAGGDDTPDSGSATTSAASFADVAVAPAPVAAAPVIVTPPSPATVDLNPAPEMTGGTNVGPAFSIPCGVIEGQMTQDGRSIVLDALDFAPMPLALMFLDTSTHDPSGFSGNDPAVLAGRIDSVERVPGENGTQIIKANGVMLNTEDGQRLAETLSAMGRLPVSADIVVEDSQVTSDDFDDFGWPLNPIDTLIKGTLQAFTVLPHSPAFPSCYIVMGDAEPPAPIEQAVEPVEGLTASVVNWLTTSTCVPCSEGVEVITASGGPARPPMAWFENPNFTDGDGRLMSIIAQGKFGRMVHGQACPMTVTEDGQVFGHIAPWGTCHVGQPSKCVSAPHSAADYAHFKRGQHVVTAEGESVRVGVLTANTGHAKDRGIGAADAMAHYDNTGFAVADVNIGEDEYGIWVAGALRPDATDEQVRLLRASSVSGDWRNMGGSLELVAALCVNQPGFPMAVVASGELTSLVAAGASVMAHLAENQQELFEGVFVDDPGDVALRLAVAPLLEERKAALRAQRFDRAKAESRERILALRSALT